MKEEELIPLNYKKIVLLMLGSLIFTSIGIIFLYYDFSISFSSVLWSFITLFFGLISSSLLMKLFQSYSILFKENTLLDNTTGFVSKEIFYKDIDDVFITKVGSQKFITILVKNPENYIKHQKNILEKVLMKLNYNIYGSPFFLNKNAIDYNFDELSFLLKKKIKKYK